MQTANTTLSLNHSRSEENWMAKISPERITAYYTGYLIAAIGVLLFLSNFFTFGVSMPRAIGEWR